MYGIDLVRVIGLVSAERYEFNCERGRGWPASLWTTPSVERRDLEGWMWLAQLLRCQTPSSPPGEVDLKDTAVFRNVPQPLFICVWFLWQLARRPSMTHEWSSPRRKRATQEWGGIWVVFLGEWVRRAETQTHTHTHRHITLSVSLTHSLTRSYLFLNPTVSIFMASLCLSVMLWVDFASSRWCFKLKTTLLWGLKGWGTKASSLFPSWFH